MKKINYNEQTDVNLSSIYTSIGIFGTEGLDYLSLWLKYTITDASNRSDAKLKIYGQQTKETDADKFNFQIYDVGASEIDLADEVYALNKTAAGQHSIMLNVPINKSVPYINVHMAETGTSVTNYTVMNSLEADGDF